MNTLPYKYYLGQRNNRNNPSGSCNVTMLCMIGLQSGHKKEMDFALKRWNEKYNTNYLQWEDSLYYHIQKLYSEKNHPERWFNLLVEGGNHWIGKNIFSIDWSASLYDIIHYIDSSYGVGFSASFPNTDGHMVNLGYIDENKIIINDPWGNYHTRYKDKKGYNIEMSIEDFIEFRFNKKDTSMRFYIFLGEPK